MRTPYTLVVGQLSAMLCLTFIASVRADQVWAQQNTEAKQEGEPTDRNSESESPGLLKKLEDWVGVTDKLEDLAKMAKRLQVEIDKMKTQHKETVGVQTPSQDPPAAAAPVSPEPPIQNQLEVALPVLTEPPAPGKSGAEVGSNDSFDSMGADAVEETRAIPFLNGSTPDWVKNGLVQGDEHSFAISSTLMQDLDLCREDLRSRMMSEVRVYLDKHVLEFAEAYQLPALTQEYVEKYWVKRGQEFDNVQDRPSGTYHQLWIGLHISAEQLSKIKTWEKQSVREGRTRKVGVLGGASVFAIALLSGAVGLLARREKARLKA